MKQVEVTPKTIGRYLVRFTPDSVWDEGWPDGNDALPATISPSNIKGKINVLWDNKLRASVLPEGVQAFELDKIDIKFIEESEEYDLHKLYKEQKDTKPTLYKRSYKKGLAIQLCGIEIYLMPDGTYFLNDTTGG